MPLIGTDEHGHPWSGVIDSITGQWNWTLVANVTPSTADNSITIGCMALITSALRLIGVLASGEQPDISTANESLAVLDQMVDSWNADRLAIFTTRADDYALVLGQQVYTLGPGGDFNSNRPARIDAMSAILLNNPTNPVEVPMSLYTVDQWQTQVPVKTVPGSFPLLCYDDGGYPLRTLSMWPIPSEQPCNVRIYSWQGLGIPSTLQSSLSFPPGYARALRYNLAIDLSAEFAAPASATVQAIAIESFARIKTMNAPDLGLQSDLVPSPAGYNWRADLFGIPY